MRRIALRHALPVLLAWPWLAAAEPPPPDDLASLDLTELMNMDVIVTSAARRAQAGGDAAAAVFVLTREDIRRSGATSIPELLRVVPGVQVARAANSRWAVTARGFNGRFANKLLVLVDGRSIYSSMFGGVLWEEQNVPLDEIDRIEVVRGPGGALWGANAVNGVINIITSRAGEDPGLRITAGAGTDEPGALMARYAAQGKWGDYRLYGDAFERDSFQDGMPAWKHAQGGVSWESAVGPGRLTVHGEMQRNDTGDYLRAESRTPAIVARTASLGAGWEGPAFAGATLQLRGSYSFRDADKYGVDSIEKQSALALDAQYGAPRRGRHLLTAGIGVDLLRDRLLGIPGFIGFDPVRENQQLWGLYAQDEIYFHGDDLRLILGAKLDKFEFVGTKFQPTVRSLWRVNKQHTVWGAVSRAVRTPDRFELHGFINSILEPGPPAQQFNLSGNSNLDAESLRAYELGWRWRPAQHLSFDTTVFRNEYAGIVEARLGTAYPDPVVPDVLIIPGTYNNYLDLDSHGVEISADYKVTDYLRLQAGGSWFDLHLPTDAGDLGTYRGVDSHRVFTAQARFDLPRQVELDLQWRLVGEAPGRDGVDYDSLNVRLGWRPHRSLRLSLSVENLFDEAHVEFYDEDALSPGAVLDRSVFLRIGWDPGR